MVILNGRASGQALADKCKELADSGSRPIAHLPIHYSYGLPVVNSHLLAGCSRGTARTMANRLGSLLVIA